jgi:hypothetical protein
VKKKRSHVFKRSERFVGGFLPLPTISALNLLVLGSRTSKNALIRELIEDRIKGTPTSTLIRSIAQVALDKFRGEMSFVKYEGIVEEDLAWKKISPAHIKKIISEMRNLYAENKANCKVK